MLKSWFSVRTSSKESLLDFSEQKEIDDFSPKFCCECAGCTRNHRHVSCGFHNTREQREAGGRFWHRR